MTRRVGSFPTHGEIIGAATTAVIMLAYLGAPVQAHATGYGIELNGTYSVTSNGDWAITNDVYRDEATVRDTWTISSSCTAADQCTGQVTSLKGWTAPLSFTGSRWIVARVVDNWEPCPDGTAAPGNQKYQFWGVGDSAMVDHHSNVLAGTDITQGPSGACGINKELVIRLPLRLAKVS